MKECSSVTDVVNISVEPATEASHDGTSLALLRLPFVFTQDRLLRSDAFVSEAKKWGFQLDLDDLANLDRLGLLVPLYRVDDDEVEGRIISPAPTYMGELAPYARQGRVRDPASEGYSAWWPYHRPSDVTDRSWWDGHLFSIWQLLHVQRALCARRFWELGSPLGALRRQANDVRSQRLALCALSPRHLPGIVGQLSLPGGASHDAFDEAQFGIEETPRLQLAGFAPERLLPSAEALLASASMHDSMMGWWPLIRHSNHLGWSKLKGDSLRALWERIAAEILLRAHEHLADLGVLEPLPRVANSHSWQPLQDRITAREDSEDSLDSALGALGLSPYPRVLLLLEGETEMVHVPRLLEEFGIEKTNQVRVQNAHGSNKNPQLVARYAVSPRIGKVKAGVQYLDAIPTALFVAMDPENKWSAQKREQEGTKLKNALREEVKQQGGSISDSELDFLVRIVVWGEQCYELANFSDDELTVALQELAFEQKISGCTEASWLENVRGLLSQARTDHSDIKIVMQKARIHTQKPRLAEILLPTLLSRLEIELGADDPVITPIFALMLDVKTTVAQLSSSGYVLEQ